MAEKRQQGLVCSKKIAKIPNYNKDKLGELVDAIISRTLASEMKLRKVVEDCTESAVKAKRTKIEVIKDVRRFKIILRIQFTGCSDIWAIHVYANRNLMKVIHEFYEQAKKAAVVIREQEDQNIGEEHSVPSPEGLGASGDDGAVDPQPKNQRKKRVMAASVVTTEVVVEILEKFLQITGGVLKIDQREFWEIISPLGIATSRISVLAILQKKCVVNVLMPVKRKPVVEITQLGIDMLESHKQRLEDEKLEMEEDNRLQKTLAFPGKFLDLLKEWQDLLAAYAELEELKNAENDIPRQIAALQEALAKIEPAKKKCLEKIEGLASQINPGKIAELVEIAEKSAMLKS